MRREFCRGHRAGKLNRVVKTHVVGKSNERLAVGTPHLSPDDVQSRRIRVRLAITRERCDEVVLRLVWRNLADEEPVTPTVSLGSSEPSCRVGICDDLKIRRLDEHWDHSDVRKPELDQLSGIEARVSDRCSDKWCECRKLPTTESRLLGERRNPLLDEFSGGDVVIIEKFSAGVRREPLRDRRANGALIEQPPRRGRELSELADRAHSALHAGPEGLCVDLGVESEFAQKPLGLEGVVADRVVFDDRRDHLVNTRESSQRPLPRAKSRVASARLVLSNRVASLFALGRSARGSIALASR